MSNLLGDNLLLFKISKSLTLWLLKIHFQTPRLQDLFLSYGRRLSAWLRRLGEEGVGPPPGVRWGWGWFFVVTVVHLFSHNIFCLVNHTEVLNAPYMIL